MQFKKHLTIAALCGFTVTVPFSVFADPAPETAPQEQYETLLRDGMERLVIQPSGAYEYFNLAVQKSPRSWEAWGYRALARERMGDYKGAIADYTKALDLKPHSWDFSRNMLMGRGRAFASYARHHMAIEDFSQVIDSVENLQQAPSDTQTSVIAAYLGRGQCYEALEQYDEAMSDYDSALRLRPNNHVAGEMKLQAASKLRDHKQQMLSGFIQIDPVTGLNRYIPKIK